MKRHFDNIKIFVAGHSKTDAEIEEMLESGNPAVFTQGVSDYQNKYFLNNFH